MNTTALSPLFLRRFDAIVFDCDGVLVDSEIICQRFERQALSKLGLNVGPAEFRRRFAGLATHRILEVAAHELAIDLPETLLDETYAALADAMADLSEVPGAIEAVDATRVARAVASNSDRPALRDKLVRTRLLDRFDGHWHSRDDVAVPKPAPDLFLRAASAMGVAPDRVLVIEDSVPGVRAGVCAGATVIGFIGGAHQDEAGGRELLAAGAATVLTSWINYAILARAAWQ